MQKYVSNFRITEHLGSGEFGTVCKGFWHTSHGSVEVAIKMVNNKVYLQSFTFIYGQLEFEGKRKRF